MRKIPAGNVYLDPQFLLNKIGVETGMTVGDFGCGGAGYYTMQAARLVGDKGKVFAVDVIKSDLSALVSKSHLLGFKNIRPVWSNLEIFNGAKAITNDSLDAAVLINVLHQSKKHLAMFKECARMLKKGAKILVVDWKKIKLPFSPPQKSLVNRDEVKKWAHEAGLAEMEEFQAGHYHFGIIFTKSV